VRNSVAAGVGEKVPLTLLISAIIPSFRHQLAKRIPSTGDGSCRARHQLVVAIPTQNDCNVAPAYDTVVQLPILRRFSALRTESGNCFVMQALVWALAWARQV